jgi:hypothetical protein
MTSLFEIIVHEIFDSSREPIALCDQNFSKEFDFSTYYDINKDVRGQVGAAFVNIEERLLDFVQVYEPPREKDY